MRTRVSRGLRQACVTGAVPPPLRLRGRLRWAWAVKPWTLPASLTLAQRPAGGCGTDRVALLPLEVALQHRPPSPSARCRHEAADLAGGYPLRIVRIAPLHDAGITVSRSCTLRSFTLWAKLHSHACRGASRRSLPAHPFGLANASCVHVLFRFVKFSV